MSQVFSADSVSIVGSGTATLATESPVATGNFLNPPFQNAKAVVIGTLSLTAGTGTTAVVVRIRRNPNAENFLVAGSSPITAAAGNTVALAFSAADPIPDGRPVQYQLTVTQTGGTANGTIQAGTISTMLISG